MATPVKNITYINGVNSLGATTTISVATVQQPMLATALRLPPPLWLKVSWLGSNISTVNSPFIAPIYMIGQIATKLTLFWRDAVRRPRRGQLWPRTR